MEVKKLKGFRDILPAETPLWQEIEATVHDVCGRYGYQEIRLPLLEETALFSRSIGETTDIVEKEMYTFPDTSGTLVTLRPEGTASAVRAYLENGFHRSDPKVRLYYMGPMFRRERPQKGRLRQFHQIGAECFGWPEPWADADVLCLLWDLFAELGLADRISLEVNSLGCAQDRARYVRQMRAFLAPRRDRLCENCQRRLDVNTLRVLDCKSIHCQEMTADVPSLSKNRCRECDDHFETVLRQLKAQRIPCAINPRMVRGLDYYNRTTFELLSEELGAQNAVAGGGRYDGLVQTLGGPEVPALGFSVGVERLALLLQNHATTQPKPFVCLVHRGEAAVDEALLLRRELVQAGIRAGIDYEPRSLKAQLRAANRQGARFVLILGEDELSGGHIALKDMSEGTQEIVNRRDAVERLVALASAQTTEV